MHAALYALVLAATHAAALLPRADNGPVHLDLHNTEPRQRSLEHDAITARGRYSLFKRQTGDSLDASLTNHIQQRYSVKVTIGTPAQDFMLAFDTGSPGTWVYDSSCTPTMCGAHSTGFDASKSSTYTANNRTGLRPGVRFVTTYCNGLWGWDTVGVGSSQAPQAGVQSATEYPFLRCTEGNVTSDDREPPGVIGFSWPVPSYPEPLWTHLVKDWKDKRFGVYLAHQSAVAAGQALSDADPNGGVLTLGGVNTALYTGDITYVPNIALTGRNHTFWAVRVDSANVGNASFAPNTVAIVDTGSPLSGVPTSIYRAVYGGVRDMQMMRQTGVYFFPCESANAIPPLELTLGGVRFTIPAEDLYHEFVEYSASSIPGFRAGPSGRLCRAQLQQIEGEEADLMDWMFGDVILRNLYQVYQYDPPAIGFARVADSASTAAANNSTGQTAGQTASSGVGGGSQTPTGFGKETTATASDPAVATQTRAPSGAQARFAGAGAVLLGVAVSLLA